jgi:DNA-binding MarR family transcriptional regulator
MTLVSSILRAQQLFLGRLESALRPLGLSFARYEILLLLSFSADGALPMTSVTARLQVHPASVTNTVDRLERDGQVTKSAHPTDGRAIVVTLTDQGRDVVRKSTEVLNASVFERPGIADPELSSIVRALARFREESGDFTPLMPRPNPL